MTSGLEQYKLDGWMGQESIFTESELKSLREEKDRLLSLESERRSVDSESGEPYRYHGPHLDSALFGAIAQDERIAGQARELLGEEIYVYQSKINVKPAFSQADWGWHQDFTFWYAEDKLPEGRALTAAVLLEDATAFNGSLVFVPGGHRGGMMMSEARSEGWGATRTNSLKYTLIDHPEFAGLVENNGLAQPVLPAGSVVWFSSLLPHASGNNLSSKSRSLILLSYNACSNKPAIPSERPEWLSARNTAPIPIEPSERFRTLAGV